jgi:hypothetical protein
MTFQVLIDFHTISRLVSRNKGVHKPCGSIIKNAPIWLGSQRKLVHWACGSHRRAMAIARRPDDERRLRRAVSHMTSSYD